MEYEDKESKAIFWLLQYVTDIDWFINKRKKGYSQRPLILIFVLPHQLHLILFPTTPQLKDLKIRRLTSEKE